MNEWIDFLHHWQLVSPDFKASNTHVLAFYIPCIWVTERWYMIRMIIYGPFYKASGLYWMLSIFPNGVKTSLKVNSVLDRESNQPISTSILSNNFRNINSVLFLSKLGQINLFLQNLKKYNTKISIYFLCTLKNILTFS